MHSILLISITGSLYASAVVAAVITPGSQYTPEANCTIEGTYKCVTESAFQQCRWGHWSEIAKVDSGNKCDFHDEVGWQASSLTYGDVYGRVSSLSKARDLIDLDEDQDGDGQYEQNIKVHRRQASNRLVPDPPVLDPACPKKKNYRRNDVKFSESTSSDNDAHLVKRAFDPIPHIVFCGETQDRSRIYFDTDVRRALNYARGLNRHAVYNYPKEFHNHENINVHGCEHPLYEYPLWARNTFGGFDVAGTRRERENPGGERVIFDRCGNLCAVTWHPFPPPNYAVDDCIYG